MKRPAKIRHCCLEPLEARIAPATFTWISGSSGAWATAANWNVTGGVDADGVPDADDDVAINLGGFGVTVTVSSGLAEAKTISVTGNNLLAVTGGTFVVQEASTVANLSVSGSGRFASNAQVTLTGTTTISGTTEFFNGTLRNEGTMSIAGTMTLVDTLTNAGDITISGRLLFGAIGRVNNLAEGEVTLANASGGDVIAGFGTVPGFFNAGTVRHGAAVTTTVAAPYTNLAGAIIEVTAGTLNFTSPNNWTGADLRISAGAEVNFAAGRGNLSGFYTGSGTGHFNFKGGTQGASAGVEVNLDGATFNFPAGFFSIGENAQILGDFTNAGSLQISLYPDIRGTITNSGTIYHSGRPDLYGAIDNLAGGLYVAASGIEQGGFPNSLFIHHPLARFTNAGTFLFTTSLPTQVNVPFDNLPGGIIEATAGTLLLNGGGTWGSSDFLVSPGAEVAFVAGAVTMSGTFEGTGGGTVRIGGGVQGASAGVYVTPGTAGVTMNFPGDMLVWSGNASIDPGAQPADVMTNLGAMRITDRPNLNGVIDNFGAVKLFGSVDLNGQFNNKVTGTLEMATVNGGAFTGNGILSNAGLLRVTTPGTHTLATTFHSTGGAIEVTAGALAIPSNGTWNGANFTVATDSVVALDGGFKTWAGTFNGTGGGIVRLGGGTQGASAGGQIDLSAAGAIFNFTGGGFEFSGNATLGGGGQITNLGVMTVFNMPNHGGSTIDNAGTIRIRGQLEMFGDAKITNLSTGTIEFDRPGAGTVTSGNTSNGIFNYGKIRSTQAGNTYVYAGFHNLGGGSIDVLAGNIGMYSDGTWEGGTFQIAAGSWLVIDTATKVWAGDFIATGGGNVRLGGGSQGASGGGTVMIGATGATIDVRDGGYFEFGGNSTLTGDGVVAGKLVNRGKMIYTHYPNLGVSIVNEGLIQAYGRLDPFGGVAQIHNKVGGVFELRHTYNENFLPGGGGSPGLINEGTLISLTSFGVGSSVALNNTGIVRSAGGGLFRLNGSTAQLSGGTLTGGTWIVDAGSALELQQNVTTNNAIVELHGTSPHLNAIRTNNGDLTIGRTFTSTTAFTNNGTLTLAPGGTLAVTGALTFSVGATTTFEIGGTAAASFGKITATGAATLRGTARVDLVNSYIPAAGDSFTLMSYASKTGDFARIEGLQLGRDRLDPAFEAVVSATNFRIGSLQNAADLAVTNVTLPAASGLAGQNFAFSYTVQNVSPFAVTTGAWTDSIYLSLDGTYDGGDVLLARVTHTGALAAGASYTENFNLPLPGALPNDYRLVVVSDSRGFVPDAERANNEGASAGTFAYDVPTLADGVPVAGNIASGQQLFFKLTVPAGQTPVFTFTGAAAGQAELFSSLGQVPTRAAYDESAFDAARASFTTTHDTNLAATYYVLLHGRENAGAGQTFTLLGDALDLGVTGLGTARGANVGTVTTRIDGTLFTAGTTFALVPAGGGASIAAGNVFVQGVGKAFATFDLTGAAAGAYHLVANDGGASDTLLNAFTVTAGTVRPDYGGLPATGATEGQLVYDISSPSFIRPPFNGAVVVLTYQNVGGTDIPAPLFNVFSTNARMRMADETGFSTGVLELLGVNPNGLAGVLSPGAKGSIEIIFEPINSANGSEVNFEVQVASNYPLDMQWDTIKEDLRPAGMSADAWNPIYENFKAGVGDTLGSYHATLIENANYLSRFGPVSADVGRLFQFELEQADDFGAISARYVNGALGFGKAGPFSMRAFADADGVVTLVEGDSTRGFVPLVGGGYRSTGADTATLTKAGAIFTLTESSGDSVVFRADGRIDYVEDTNGRRHTAAWNGSGQLLSITDSETSDQTTFSYNAAGLIATATDAVGRVTTYGYDAAGHTTSVTTPQGTTTLTWFTAADGAAKNHALKTVTGPDGVTTSFTYDARGRLASQTIGSGAGAVVTTFTPDTAGGVATTDADGEISRTFRGPGGTVLQTVDETGRFLTSSYDATGRLLDTRDGAGVITSLTYDADSLASVTNGARGTTQLDIAGDVQRLQYFIDPGSDLTTFSYDAQGNLLAATQPDGFNERYEYDARGRVIAAYHASGERIAYEYDTKNLLTRTVLPDGTDIDYTYDAHRNLLTATDAGGTTTFTYDAADRITSATYPNGKVVTITYDAAGRRSTITDGAFTARYAYDALGRLDTVRDTANALLVDYDRNPLGQLVKETRGNGATTDYTYDDAGRVESIVHRDAANAVTDSFIYAYDARGRVTSVVTPGGTSTYGYDAEGQLIHAALPGGRTLTFAYDAEGNRTIVNDTAAGNAAYTTNGVDQYTAIGGTTYAYDRDGRLASSQTGGVTTTYRYDASGRLSQILKPGESVQYDYDALGNRIGVVTNGVRTDFAFDPAGLGTVFGEYTAASSANYASGLGVAARVSGGSASFYHFDAIGNTALLSGTGGAAVATYDYLPFGEISAQTGAGNLFTFNGRDGVQDDVGDLFHMRARVYDADTGRFTSRDPIGLRGGDTNFYRFVNNDPVNFSDPSGLFVPGIDFTLIAGNAGFSGTWSTVVAGLQNAASSAAIDAAFGASSAGASAAVSSAGASAVAYESGLIVTNLSGGAATPLIQYGPLGTTITKPFTTGSLVNSLGRPLNFVNGVKTAAGPAALSFAAGYAIGTGIDYLTERTNPEFKRDMREAFAQGQFIDGYDGPIYEDTSHIDNDYNEYVRDNGQDQLFNSLYKDLISRGYSPSDAVERAKQLLNGYRAEQPEDQPSDETSSRVVRPRDPNNIVGPRGPLADPVPTEPGPGQVRFDGWVNSADQFGYTILFENLPAATAPAQVVTVTQTLDADLDLSTFRWTSFGWADFKVTVPEGAIGSTFSTQVDATATLGVLVNVDAALNLNTGALTVTFTSLDPATGDLPIDPFLGFLPPNLTAPEGDGFITYSIAPDAGLADGTRFDARASIVFDTEAPLDTPDIFNTLDDLAPSSAVTAFAAPTVSRTAFLVRWTANDAPNGSGLGGTTILYRDNDGPLQALTVSNPGTFARFDGVAGHTYKFFSIADDLAGNTEAIGSVPDAIVTVVAPPLVTAVGNTFTLTDSDGDIYTAKLTGPAGATLKYLQIDANGAAAGSNGPLDFLVVENGTNKHSLTVTVKRVGDGVVAIGDVIVNGSLNAFTAKASDLNVNGFTATGTVKTIAVRDLLQPDPLLADPLIQLGGTNTDKTTITAGNLADNAVLSTPGIFSAITAGAIGDARISAASLGKLTTTVGAMNADLAITGAVGSVAVKTSANAGNWTGASFGAITAGGALAADIATPGAIAKLTVTGGDVTGQLDARSFGAVALTGGNFAGTLTSVASVSDLGKTPALASLTVTGGDSTGDITLAGRAGSITVKADKLGVGGDLGGGLTAASFGAVALTSGNFTGALTATAPADSLGKTAALASLTVTGGDSTGGITLAGRAGNITVKADKTGVGGDLGGGLTAASFGAVTLAGGNFTGTLTATAPAATLGRSAALASLSITSGDLTGDITLAGKVGNITVKADKLGTGGEVSTTSALTASSFGKVALSGGNFSGTIISLTAPADLAATPALAGLAIVGGDFTGDVRLRGNAGAISILGTATGPGGAMTNASFVAANIASLTIAKTMSNSQVLAGADLGANFAFGGTGANADTLGGGTIGAVKIGLPGATGTIVTNSVIAAGLLTGANGVPRGTGANADSIFGATPEEKLLNTIASLVITGQANSASYFAAGQFKATPKIADAVIDPAADARFFVG